jgi:Phosphotransferase system, mannose/fructose-specific component IIA
MSSVRALVAGHGTFAAGMLSAIEQITGRTDLFLGVTNHDLSAADVEALMRERLDSSGATVIFTDLPAGSCTMAARRIQRERPDLAVVTGVNLATLLDFAFHDDAGDVHAVEHAADKGRASLVVTGGPRGA